jgi:flagellar basal body-associated protein FliL
MLNKRRKKALTILVVIIVIAVAVTYILPIAILGASAAEIGAVSNAQVDLGIPLDPGDEEFGTDDPSVIPPVLPEPPKPPASLQLKSYPGNLDVGDRGQLTCELLNAPEGTYVEWNSDDPNVAVIDSTGSIVAIAPGDAVITVSAGDLRDSALIHVNDYKASKLTILVTGLSGEPDAQGRLVYKIKVGDVYRLSFRIDPQGAKVERIDWAVSDPEVAELSDDGEFVASAKGETSVTASAGVLSNTILFQIEENGIPLDTIFRYIIIGVVVIVVIIVAVILIARAAAKQKEAERKRAATAKRRKEEARQRAEDAAKRAADQAETAAATEQAKHSFEPEPPEIHSAKVSGATVSAVTGVANPHDETLERPLTLDDIE